MEQPSWLQKEVFDRIFTGCEIAGFNEEKRIIYEQEMYDEKRRRSEMNTAIRMGREEGRAEGRAEIAREMILDRVPVDKISQYTGLTVEEVNALIG